MVYWYIVFYFWYLLISILALRSKAVYSVRVRILVLGSDIGANKRLFAWQAIDPSVLFVAVIPRNAPVYMESIRHTCLVDNRARDSKDSNIFPKCSVWCRYLLPAISRLILNVGKAIVLQIPTRSVYRWLIIRLRYKCHGMNWQRFYMPAHIGW